MIYEFSIEDISINDVVIIKENKDPSYIVLEKNKESVKIQDEQMKISEPFWVRITEIYCLMKFSVNDGKSGFIDPKDIPDY